MEDFVLQLKDITKVFPGVKALSSMQFDLRRGSIHALIGENGAGKSTLMKVLSGIYTPEAGTIILDGQEVKMGMQCSELPTPFGEAFVGQLMPVHKMYYLLAGRTNPEQFYLINNKGQTKDLADKLTVKGVFTQNKYYTNWGTNNSAYHTFKYEKLTQDSTIEDVLEQYGQPLDLRCTSYARNCFAWLFYKDQSGNTLEICVDPILNQLIELRVVKYYEGEILYQ